MIICSLNANGVGSDSKKKWIREICKDNYVNFIGIQESKSDKEDGPFIHSLWGSSNCDFAIKKAVGNSGGIIAIWDVTMLRKNKVIVDEDGFIAIYEEWINTRISCLMIVVYAPQDANSKCSLWSRLTHLIVTFHGMSIVLGDFNEIQYASERLGTTFCKKGATLFNGFINNSNLVDLQMGGRKFTRMNKFGTKLSKIDRILVSSNFVSKWPNAQLTILSRNLSDHCPIILKTHSTDFGPIPFKFFNSWLLNSEFPLIVSGSWNTPITLYNPHPACILKFKLQCLKKTFVFGVQMFCLKMIAS